MTYKDYCKSELNYETKTTYFEDFSIAERFGKAAMEDTFKKALDNGNYQWITELSMVLNHKIWFTYEKNEPLARIYDDLWKRCNQHIYDTFSKEELEYFFRVTD